MALKMIQRAIDRSSEDSGYTFGVTDPVGMIIACSDKKMNGIMNDEAVALMQNEEIEMISAERINRKIIIRNKIEYIVFVNETSETARMCLSVLAAGIESMRLSTDEKTDRQSLLRGILMDNILPGDIILKARELRIPTEGLWGVILVKSAKPVGINLMEVLQSLFPSKQKDFLILVDDVSIVLIKELKSKDEVEDLTNICLRIVDTVSSELMINITIGVGSVVESIRDIAKSYKEAQLSIIIGGIFESGKSVLNYNKLGIGRLVYQLPTKLCNLFLNEVFKDKSDYIFQKEIINSINQLFECNFNISEAAKNLYVHRNTLVYRLDKVERDYGLDLRKFNDAVVLKFAIMVKKYLDSIDGGSKG